MEPPLSRYRRVELGCEGSAGRAQQAADSHSHSSARRCQLPGKRGRRRARWGERRLPAARLRALDRSKMASRGATCRGTAAPPAPPRLRRAPPRRPHVPGRAPDPDSAPLRPSGRRDVRSGAGLPGRPAPHPRAPPTARCSGPRPSAALSGPPRPSGSRRLRPRTPPQPPPPRSPSFPEGQRLDFTGTDRGFLRRF